MRLGTVIGRVTLSQAVPALEGGRFLIVSPFTREHFQRGTETPPGMSKDQVWLFMMISAAEWARRLALSKAREAAQPFEQPTPVDAINAALVDEIFYNPWK